MSASLVRSLVPLAPIALVFHILLPACDDPGKSSAPQTSGSVTSSPSSAGEFDLDVIAVRTCPPDPNSSLADDEVLLGVNVRLRAMADQVPQNYYYGRIVDREGQRHDAGFAGCEPRLSGPPLLSGQSGAGFINFRLPRDASGLTLEYSPRIGNRAQAAAPSITKTLAR